MKRCASCGYEPEDQSNTICHYCGCTKWFETAFIDPPPTRPETPSIFEIIDLHNRAMGVLCRTTSQD